MRTDLFFVKIIKTGHCDLEDFQSSARDDAEQPAQNSDSDAAHQRWIGRRVTSQAGARLLRALACRRCTWACSHCNRRHLSACCLLLLQTPDQWPRRRRWLLDSLLRSAQSADYGSGQADTDCLRAQLLSFAPSLCAHGCSARPRASGPFCRVSCQSVGSRQRVWAGRICLPVTIDAATPLH